MTPSREDNGAVIEGDSYFADEEDLASPTRTSSAREILPRWLQEFDQKFGVRDPSEEGSPDTTDVRVVGDNAKPDLAVSKGRQSTRDGPDHPGRRDDLSRGIPHGRNPNLPSMSNLQDGRQAHEFEYPSFPETSFYASRKIEGSGLPMPPPDKKNSPGVPADKPWNVLGVSEDADAET